MARENLVRLQPRDDVAPLAPQAGSDVLIHVRFTPSAEINSIGEKPAHLSAKEWFERLLDLAGPHYQTFAGGRGFFRIPRVCFEAITKDAAA
jgi:hypothetical protein